MGESRGVGGAPVGPAETSAPAGTGPELSSPAVGERRTGQRPPLPDVLAPHSPHPPRSARRSSLGHFGGLESSGPRAEGGRVPSVMGGGGGMHQRDAGGAEAGRAWEAGRARPSQEDSASAPTRRSSGTSTWRSVRPGAGPSDHAGPPKKHRKRV